MSRQLARSLVVGSTMFMLIACAQIADIQDPDPSTSASKSTPTSNGASENPAAPPTTTTPGAPGTPGTSTPGTPTPAPDAGADTSTPPPATCQLKVINAQCDGNSECCSSHCSQNKVCVTGCDQNGCDSPFSATCCLGNYCGNAFFCKPCIAQGQPADRFLGTNAVNERSCCSGNANSGNCL